MTTMPVRLDRLQAGLRASLAAAHPSATVVWAPSAYPRSTGAALLFAVRLVSGPRLLPTSRRVGKLPTVQIVRLLGAVAGEAVQLDCSGRVFEYEIRPGDDVEAARDGLLASIGATPMISASFEPLDDDAIRISADALGDLYDVAVRATSPGLIALDGGMYEVCEIVRADVETLVEIQAYSTSRYPMDGATAAISKWQASRRLREHAAVLDGYGLSIVGGDGTPVSLDSLAGADWQSRAALSLYVSQISLAAGSVETIESVGMSLEIRDADYTPYTIGFEVPA